jgi:Putative beta-barrel porin-2, OmpL-like. bbp2
MKKNFRYVLLFTLLAAFGLTANAQSVVDSASTDKKGKLTFSGYVDAFYFANMNNPKSQKNLGNSGFERAFDQRAGQFQVGLVQTKMNYSTSKVDVVADLTFGNNADLGNYGNVIGPLGRGTTALAIKQAYITYKATDKLSFTMGQFGTHIGYEVIDAPLNYNYSLSNLFNNGPFYHVGIKANLAISDKFSLMAGVVNGVDNMYDNNKAKGFIAQAFISPAEGWNVYLNWMGSDESTVRKDSTGFFSLLDLTTTYQVTEKFFVGLNAAYGSQKGDYQGVTPYYSKAQTWGGVALYSNVKFSDVAGIGIRAEYFDNTSGVRFMRNVMADSGTDVFSFTLTPNFTLADGMLTLKPEFRIDSFKKIAGAGNEGLQQFEDSDGNFTKSSQATIGLATVFKF